ncbi:C5orf34 isoform 3, partial [Pan troglodytes]
SPGTKHTCVYTWVKQCWSVAACPEEWKYPLSLALHFHNKISNMSKIDAHITQSRFLTSDISEERGKVVSVLPRALSLSCPVPHLHRWNFCDSLLQRQSDEYSYPELVKMVWYKGVTYREKRKLTQ